MKLLLLLITATFSQCFIVTAAATGARTCLWSKKLDFKTQETMRFITLKPLGVPTLCSGTTGRAFGL